MLEEEVDPTPEVDQGEPNNGTPPPSPEDDLTTPTPGTVKDVMRSEREGLRGEVEIDAEALEQLNKDKIKEFFEGLLPNNPGITSFLASFFGKMIRKFGLAPEAETIPWEDVQEAVHEGLTDAEGKAVDVEDLIIAHRSLGYEEGEENSLEAISGALKGGEKQVEMDLRLGKDGEIYLAHDNIRGEENPSEKHAKIRDVLEEFAKPGNYDAFPFFDIKEEKILDKLDAEIKIVDDIHKDDPDYVPIADRHFIMSFNQNVVSRAKENNKKRMVVYNYFPYYTVPIPQELILGMGRNGIKQALAGADTFGKTHLADSFDNTRITMLGRELPGTDPNATDHLNIHHMFPPPEILAKVDYISVPTVLIDSKKGAEFVEEAHKKGVRVIGWGSTPAQDQKALLVYKVDKIVSDTPDVIRQDK